MKKAISIRTKITLLTVAAIAVAISITTAISSIYIATKGHKSSEEELALSCESGKNNLDYYFKSVEQAVNTVSHLVNDDLDGYSDSEFLTKFSSHIAQSKIVFNEAAKNANGVLTYYYRITPEITDVTGEKGFWYTDIQGTKEFTEHTVTEISDSSNECKWFWDTKANGGPLWLPPYITDNLVEFDNYVISYNVPVYRNTSNNDQFIGVIGIEISYKTLGDQIKNIIAGKTGFAYIVENENGSIIYHPYIDILSLPEDQRPSIPQGFVDEIKSDIHHIEYTFQGVKKHAYWLRLSNGMSVVVAVPYSEVRATWSNIVIQVGIVSVAVIALIALITVLLARRITKPLKELNEAAIKINDGNFDVKLTYSGNNEIGTLTTTFNNLVDHMGRYIEDLNQLAYADALTSLKNKGAFDVAMSELQTRMLDKNSYIGFAIAIFDCDNLKTINDKYGHDKGNVYLKNSSNLISRVYKHSDVYRLGGDEFAIILEGTDYLERENLGKLFYEMAKEICSFAKEEWEEIHVSVGIAVYDEDVDKTPNDVFVHADHLMYENKRKRKRQSSK